MWAQFADSNCALNHASKLETCVVLVSAAGSHGRCWRRQPLVHQHLHFDATIFSAAGASRVVRNRIEFAETIRRHNVAKRNLVLLDKVSDDGVGATDRKSTRLNSSH